MKYRKISSIDNFMKEAWGGLSPDFTTEDAVKFLLSHDKRDEPCDEIPFIYDGSVFENEQYIAMYGDFGMCEQVDLYEKVRSE